MQDGTARTRCIFCDQYIAATPVVVLRHLARECPRHLVRELEQMVMDLIELLLDRRVADSDKVRIILEHGMASLMLAENHLGFALERLRDDRETATEVVNGMKEVMLCHKLLTMMHPQGIESKEAGDSGKEIQPQNTTASN